MIIIHIAAKHILFALTLSLLVGGANASTLIDNGNGIVTDAATGLDWEQAPTVGNELYSVAVSYCDNLSLGGKTNWRLPDVKEVGSLVDGRSVSPSINVHAFPSTTASYYWTSTIDASVGAGDPLRVWIVLFDGVFITSTTLTNPRLVRCVHR